jgi:hypothetical protein
VQWVGLSCFTHDSKYAHASADGCLVDQCGLVGRRALAGEQGSFFTKKKKKQQFDVTLLQGGISHGGQPASRAVIAAQRAWASEEQGLELGMMIRH